MTTAQKSWGTTVSFDGVTIGEIVSLNGSRTRNMIDVLSCDSTDEAVERLTAGLDEGTWSFTAYAQPGNAENYRVLNDKYLAAKKSTLLISGPTPAGGSAPTISVQGIISSLSIPQFGSPREVKMVEFSIITSGKVTDTDSSGASTSSSPSASVSASPSASVSASPSSSASA